MYNVRFEKKLYFETFVYFEGKKLILLLYYITELFFLLNYDEREKHFCLQKKN